ncbi:MAG TPA: LysM peptidoglycan-binding domain-containing protein [Gemmatimonadales bacterium]|nr:LysM peptidoglycan-binding domain-containing protein [Gemmatimonadales bacterium]
MHRFAAILAVALLAGCAGRSAPGSGPEPLPAVLDSPSDPQSVTEASGRNHATDSLGSPIEAEIAAELETAADSVADEEALEELASAGPSADDGADPVGTTWDIDVETFNGHDRVQHYLDYFTGNGRERMAIWLERLPRYEEMIRTRLAEHDLPGDLVYLALIESGFSNRAVSRARAVGMWQFMPATGRAYGLRIDGWIDERRDPVKATAAAARHLRDLRERFGSLYLAAAAYNAGAGRVGRGLNALGPDEEAEDSLHSDATFFRLYNTQLIRRETKDYVPKLIAAAIIAKEPARYGFHITEADEPFRADSVIVTDMTGLDVIARLADTTVAAIRDLNPQYLRLVTPPGLRTVVRVPVGRGESTSLALAELPERERVTFREHIVARGDTPSGVAKRHGVSLAALYEANPRIRKRHIQPGQRLVIPVGGAMSTVVARSVSEPVERVITWHRVKRGETLSHIARRYDVSQSQIQRWNNLGRSTRIKAGQRLRIGETPTERARVATRGSTHTVRSGETLTGVAKRYGVSLRALSSANGLSTTSKIRIGQRLRIPS